MAETRLSKVFILTTARGGRSIKSHRASPECRAITSSVRFTKSYGQLERRAETVSTTRRLRSSVNAVLRNTGISTASACAKTMVVSVSSSGRRSKRKHEPWTVTTVTEVGDFVAENLSSIPEFEVVKQAKTRRELKREERLETQREERRERDLMRGDSSLPEIDEQVLQSLVRSSVDNAVKDEIVNGVVSSLPQQLEPIVREIDAKLRKQFNSDTPQVRKLRLDVTLSEIFRANASKKEDVERYCALTLRNFGVPCRSIPQAGDRDAPILRELASSLDHIRVD